MAGGGREGMVEIQASRTIMQSNNAITVKQLGTSGIIRKQFVAVIVRLATPKIVRRDEIVYLILYQQLYHGFRTRFPPNTDDTFFSMQSPCRIAITLQ